jgi:DNA processing protein
VNSSAPKDETKRLSVAVAVGVAPRLKRQQLLQQLAEGESFESLALYLSESELQAARDILDICKERAIEVIPYTSDRYPALLRASSSPPAALYVRARAERFAFPQKIVSVVGTRAASVEMCQRASLISLQLAQGGLCVASGLALGVDGAAHRGALTASTVSSTIAVVAHGLDRVYPSSHLQLADSIVEKGGALVSEYPPGTEPFKHHFLERNRIIAGLSLGVVVVQAGERSGSLVTAHYAADFGRDVFVLEGADGDTGFSGGARLIEDGAIPIAGAREVLEEYGVKSAEEGGDCSSSWQTLSIPEYLEKTGCSASQMLRLEMEGQVIRLPGNKVSVMLG